METFQPATKVHDETRQGEAYAPFANDIDINVFEKKFYIESYGCQMNFSDSEIVASILNNEGFGATRNYEEADIVLINTCSIREKAEQTIRKRLTEFKRVKEHNPGMLIGVLGCMAERLKAKFLEEEKSEPTKSIIVRFPQGKKVLNCLILLSRCDRWVTAWRRASWNSSDDFRCAGNVNGLSTSWWFS